MFAALDCDIAPEPVPEIALTSRRVKEEALDLLRDCTIEGHTILAMPPVDREIYEEFATVIERLRGKWKRGKGHVFPYDPSLAIAAVLSTGLMPDDNPHAYFPTPASIAKDLVDGVNAQWWPRGDWSTRKMRVLEPSAGWGALADAVRDRWPQSEIVCCEIDPLNAATLRSKGYTVHEVDFLQWSTDEHFDIVIGNPPFSVKGDGDAWMTHLEHAWSMLREGGCCGWIMPGAGKWKHSARKKYADFREWLQVGGAKMTDHADAAFKDSGTTCKTCDLVVAKYGEIVPNPNQDPKDQYWSHDAELVSMYSASDRDMHTRGSALSSSDRGFIRECMVFANREHGGGIAVTQKLEDELAEHWPWI